MGSKMEIERDERQGEHQSAKRTWLTPRVIVSDQPVKDTENTFGGGPDGGAFPSSHS
jgi:hypothetical protein